MGRYDDVQSDLRETPKTWLVTGVAGFIGSNLLEKLLSLDQSVVGLDNFATGFAHNLDDVRGCVSEAQWARFSFIEGDILELEVCRRALRGVDHVSHQAALGSVPRSLENPIATHQANVDGFLNMLVAAREEAVTSFTYAASSSTYGDSEALPKVERRTGKPMSPYAVTKLANELYAEVFARCYGFATVGLRYFNVFGPRQNPEGAYAAVIPRWIGAMLRGEPVYINGDGETSRDFTYIDNAVQANLLAAMAGADHRAGVYNVAVGQRTSLNELYTILRDTVADGCGLLVPEPRYRDFRAGDVRHSLADISLIEEQLRYRPAVDIRAGLEIAVSWLADHLP